MEKDPHVFQCSLSPPHFPLQGPNQQSRPSCPSQPLPGVAIIFWSNINAMILYLLTNPQPINIICQLFTDPEVCSQVPGGYIDQGSECIIDFLSEPHPLPRSAACSFYIPSPSCFFIYFHFSSFHPFFVDVCLLSLNGCLCGVLTGLREGELVGGISIASVGGAPSVRRRGIWTNLGGDVWL